MKPSFRLLVSGEDITADVTRRLVQIEWTDGVEEKSDVFTVTLHDNDNSLAVPKKGAKVELSAGYDNRLQKVGSYTVDEAQVEGPPDRLTVRGSAAPFVDASGKSASSRVSFSWEETTLGDIATIIAERLGVLPEIDEGLAAIEILNEQQVNESDTNLLLRLVRRYGGFLKFTQGRMVIAEEGAGTGTGGAELTVNLTKSQCSTWRVSSGGKAEGLSKVKVKYHDYETGETKEVEAEVEQPVSAASFSDVPWLASEENTFTPPAPAANEVEAEAIAKTTAKRIARSTRQFEITLPGRLDIIAGGKVNLVGFRDGVNGRWLVKNVRHRIDSGGWSMTVSGEGAGS
jgi:phage protein D